MILLNTALGIIILGANFVRTEDLARVRPVHVGDRTRHAGASASDCAASGDVLVRTPRLIVDVLVGLEPVAAVLRAICLAGVVLVATGGTTHIPLARRPFAKSARSI